MNLFSNSLRYIFSIYLDVEHADFFDLFCGLLMHDNNFQVVSDACFMALNFSESSSINFYHFPQEIDRLIKVYLYLSLSLSITLKSDNLFYQLFLYTPSLHAMAEAVKNIGKWRGFHNK